MQILIKDICVHMYSYVCDDTYFMFDTIHMDIISVSLPKEYHHPTARDFWFGFDGICTFTIGMGILVLLRV